MEDETRRQDNELAIGKKIADQYLIEDVLGQGGMGLVLKATDLKNFNRLVVIKVLLDNLSDKWSADKFTQESRALTILQDSENIVNLLDHGETPLGRKYMVLEHIEGVVLSDVLEELPQNLPRVQNLFRQIANGVSFAHQNKIFHRDLKPENIMIKFPHTKGELVKILDFGIAKQDAPQGINVEQTTGIIGSPYYMAPNILDGNAHPVQDDIYALGLILYEMLTGQYPNNFKKQKKFSFTDLRNVQANIWDFPPKEINKLLLLDYKEIDNVIFKALDPNPEKRFESVEDFLDAFNKVMEGGTTKIDPRPSPKNGKLLMFAATALALLFALFGIGGLLYYFGSTQTPEIAAADTSKTPEISNVQNANVQNAQTPANVARNTPTSGDNYVFDHSSSSTTPTPIPTLSPNPASINPINPDDFSVQVGQKGKNNNVIPATFNQTFKAGDHIRLDVSSQKNGVVQILWKDNRGKTQKFPPTRISANKNFSFPSPNWIGFDSNPGTETIYVVISEPNSKEKIDVAILDSQSNGKTEFNTEKGSAVRIYKLNHEK